MDCCPVEQLWTLNTNIGQIKNWTSENKYAIGADIIAISVSSNDQMRWSRQ